MSLQQKQGREPIYDPALKIAVAREYLTSSLGYGRLAKKYGLKISTVSFFVRWYKENYEHLKAKNEAEKPPKPQQQGQLHDANLKITALELLIENASKELGVDYGLLIKKRRKYARTTNSNHIFKR
jgi:transposase-like protein